MQPMCTDLKDINIEELITIAHRPVALRQHVLSGGQAEEGAHIVVSGNGRAESWMLTAPSRTQP